MPFDATPPASPVLTTLLSGRYEIEKGWIQRAAYGPEGVCLIGSLGWAPTVFVYEEARNLLKRAICGLGYPDTSVKDFNDIPGRTKAQVLEVYDTAIALAQARAA